jgi:ferrochelatase
MKIAVVVYNLGGPEKKEDIKSFLFNLFSDPMIINLPTPLRWFLAKLISSRRAKLAQEIYEHLGGGSPLLQNTIAQAEALNTILSQDKDHVYKTFVAMRYWHPMANQVAEQVKSFQPDEIILLPLYPQFSTTTVGSFIKVWKKAVDKIGLNCPTKTICCYPYEKGFIESIVSLIRKTNYLDDIIEKRILFSAHGLPQKIINKGDPYQWQIEQTAKAIVKEIAVKDLDWVICYQSRVGPLEWIGPSTEEEITRAGDDGKSIVIVPIAFVSEHSETLVELDIEYKKYSEMAGVKSFFRVPTVSISNEFINGLARLVDVAHSESNFILSGDVKRICPNGWDQCPCKEKDSK